MTTRHIVRTQKTKRPQSKVGIIGLGYVGLTTAACLLEKNIAVDGYEISSAKRALLARGLSPVHEPGVEAQLASGWKKKLFRAKAFPLAEDLPDIILVCVGTPGTEDGSPDLTFVFDVFARLAELARTHPGFNSEIILRSTVPPGTLAEIRALYPELFARVPVAFYPEFLRQGTAMQNFFTPILNIVGLPKSGHRPEKMLRLLTQIGIGKNVKIVDAVTAESLKLACNAYHAVKVSFANEVARMVTACGGDALEVMDLFCRDTELNVSGKYLRPGNPYGGSCLCKDIRFMGALGARKGVKMGLIAGCEESNREHFDAIETAILSHRPKVVAMFGISFKKDTDDLRNSPSVEVLRRLTTKGCVVQAHDFLLRPNWKTRLEEKAKRPVTARYKLCGRLDSALKGADLVVVMHSDARYEKVTRNLSIPILDIARWRLAV